MNLTRRTLLKSAALSPAAALLTPILAQIEAQAAGKETTPRRVVFVLQSNGFQSYAVTPNGHTWNGNNEKFRSLDLKQYTLPEDLSPLEGMKDRVAVIQGLHGVHVGPYHGGGFGALGGVPKGKNHTALAQTIDAALARALPSVFPIVGLGLDPTQHATQTTYVCSAWAADQTIPTQCNPELAYKSLFGSIAADTKEFDSRSNLLDFMKEDIKKLEKDVGQAEREKLQTHLNALESMRGRQQKLDSMKDTLRKHAPKVDKKYTSKNECERLEAQFDIMFAALTAGLTNVVTLCSCLCQPNGVFTGLGMTETLHAIGHGSRELMTKIRKHHIEHIAKLAKKLDAIPEGNGTMLDNTLIVYTSDFADNHHSNGRNWPFLLVGGQGKKLRMGRYFEYPGYGKAGNRSINALYCTLLHAAGREVDHFNLDGGQKELDKHGPLSELLA